MDWSNQLQNQHEKAFNAASAIPVHQAEEIRQQIEVLQGKGVSSRAACRSLRCLVARIQEGA
ncbi:hypothetical protein [Candidatus Ferrigenium straubiae]|jgi:hypothetical protein|uniref:hypothetical protein n=1 Tax=Candidatus Ferrigenium straubiae TaxID=2919506 RepID=UPI003F4AA636